MNEIQSDYQEYKIAFKETYVIINDLAEDLYHKIPKEFIKMLKNNMDEQYICNIEDLYNKGINDETKIILSLIYRDFLASEEEKNKLKNYDEYIINKELEEYKIIFKDKYKKEQDNKIMKTTNTLLDNKLIKYKENIFKKIINIIKRIIGNKKY